MFWQSLKGKRRAVIEKKVAVRILVSRLGKNDQNSVMEKGQERKYRKEVR